MRFASLGSGSKGNGTLVEYGDQLLLVDCGFTIKEVERRLERLRRTPRDISAIVVTHEHSDHLKGVGPLSRKYRLPVYMTVGTYRSRDIGELADLRLIQGYRSFQVESIRVQPVAVPHDAREPAQYIFEANGKRLGILTDLGTISPHVESQYSCCDGLLLEANHDPHMLVTGPYPQSLKKRVGGPWGHLSNQQAAAFLQRVDTTQLTSLVVGHISETNNCVEKAKATLREATQQMSQVVYACQNNGFGWQSLE